MVERVTLAPAEELMLTVPPTGAPVLVTVDSETLPVVEILINPPKPLVPLALRVEFAV
jgi:hypothetical protein